MEFKRFASHGHDNPMAMDSVKRHLRSYPIKRNTWGTKRKSSKSDALKKKIDQVEK